MFINFFIYLYWIKRSLLHEDYEMEKEIKDIRWHQRFENYRRALVLLTDAVEIVTQELGKAEFEEDAYARVKDLMKEGLIKRFEYTHQLAWNVMKDFEEYQGILPMMGSRDATRYALQLGLIEDMVWMKMIDNRNLTAHTYNEDTASLVLKDIIRNYHPRFIAFETKMPYLLNQGK